MERYQFLGLDIMGSVHTIFFHVLFIAIVGYCAHMVFAQVIS